MLQDLLVHTSHFLLVADYQGKTRSDKVLEELRGQKETDQLGREQGLQAAVPELLQVDTARGTVQVPQDWRETDLELLVQVDIVQVFQDQQGTHQVLKEVLDIALVLLDQRGMKTAQVPRGQKIHC